MYITHMLVAFTFGCLVMTTPPVVKELVSYTGCAYDLGYAVQDTSAKVQPMKLR